MDNSDRKKPEWTLKTKKHILYAGKADYVSGCRW